MIKKLLLYSFLFFTIHKGLAQHARISGTISAEGSPLAFVKISLQFTDFATLSDSLGRFEMNGLPDGNYQILAKCSGYTDYFSKLKIENGNSMQLRIELFADYFQYKAVVIHNRRNAQNIFSKLDLQLRPMSSSQDLLRLVPGLFIAQHAGGGKAEQIFMRGFDIDHGTDFAIYVDGIPVNMTSHAHGQGYADLHFLIPEMVAEIEVNKGPHNTLYGDLATAGSGEFRTISKPDRNVLKLEYGMFDTRRVLGMVNLLDAGKHLFSHKQENLFTAIEYRYTNSFFEQKQKFNRINIATKYTGTMNNGDNLMLSLSTFQSRWDASGQIPNRKVADGSITPFGSIDPTEGGKTGRTNFNVIHVKNVGKAVLKNQFYYSRYDFNLYSNFTFFLKDSIHGDQIFQGDHRNIVGYSSSLQHKKRIAGRELISNTGAGIRYDNSEIQLARTVKREFLNTIVKGKLNQVNAWVLADESFAATSKLKINLGIRADIYNFNFKNHSYDTASGTAIKGIVSPKLNFAYTANDRLMLVAKTGFGFHSNDARAVIVGNLENSLARAFGNELGATFRPVSKMIVNVALWTLDLQSELVYVGDEGIVDVAGRTRRLGIDLGFRYQVTPHLFLDADLNMNRAWLRDEPEEANKIPLAPTLTSTGGITYKKGNGFSGSIRYRYMGDRAAIEDNSIIAKGYMLVDAVGSYKVRNIQFSLTIENLLNKRWKEAQFATESRLQNEVMPVNEIHYTPGTPFFAKASIAYSF